MLGLVTLAAFVNVMTEMDDARRRGVAVSLQGPVILEITSAVAALAAAAVILFAVRLAPPGRGPIWRTAAVHGVGSLVYSGAHVGLMTLMRTLLWARAGRHFAITLGELPYEYRKDLLAYVVIAGIFWIIGRSTSAPAEPRANGAAATITAPTTLDIRDANSILRVPVREILAVRAAGNYVEFMLEDGRRPLMRASVAQIEATLSPAGFLRTHRSWLVNAERVRAFSPVGSGDFRLDLGCDLAAPLSRRYRGAARSPQGRVRDLPS